MVRKALCGLEIRGKVEVRTGADISISSSRTRAAELDLNNVQDTLRTFILEYQSGSRDIKQLVSSESLKTREHISASSKETFQALGGIQKTLNSLTLEADVQVDQARRERLLQSLKFPGFNERRNQISEAHESTFNWIFVGDDGPSQEDSTGSDLDDSDWEESDLEDVDLADPSEASWDLFSNWLSSTEGIYWISGKPGSGKTTLVKYVLDHPKTAACLDIWSPRALKISHFFWRPGNEMQQSIKGLLCSLLYQLVDNSVAATNQVFQRIQDQGSKDTHTDWSVPELQLIFLQTLSSYERPILVVIDGLDEVHPADGPLELLDLVEQFPRCRNTKLCLASRPEPILKRRLSVYPHLRLQDLTRDDLDRYARDHIKLSGIIGAENVSNSSTASNTPWNPIESIVYKAEGVFLWLVLAIRNINTGCVYGDTPAIIQQRIDNLPGDLTKMYTDMWNRACEDSPATYRQTAALYFRLVLLEQDHYSLYLLPRLSLLQLMLASTLIADQLLDAVENPLNLVPEGRMLQECRELERKVELYCFGLVTFTRPTTEGLKVFGWYGSQYDGLWSRYGQRYPEFIHRTARDFLLDTFEGRDILSHGNSSESWLLSRWFKAQMASSQLYLDTQSVSRRTVSNEATAWIQFLYNRLEDFGPCDPNWTRAIHCLERLCSSGQMFAGTHNAKFCGGFDFLKAAASSFCYESIWSASKMRSLSTEGLSEALVNLCEQGRTFCKGHSYIERAINKLLHEGAEPNWMGAVSAPSGLYHDKYSEVQTPFTAYLRYSLSMRSKIKRPRQHRVEEMLENLHVFLCRSAHLDSMLFLFFWHHHSSDGCISTYILEDLGIVDAYPYDPFASGVHQFESVVVSLSAYNVLQALLDYTRTEFVNPRCTEEQRYDEVVSLIASIQKRLDNWYKPNDDCTIRRLVHEFIGGGIQGGYRRNLVWYAPSEEEPVGISGELLKALGRCLVVEDESSTERCRIVSQLVQQISWTVQAKHADPNDIWASLAELGLLARVDYEQHDMQYWFDKFQEQKSADGSFADGIKVAQCYI